MGWWQHYIRWKKKPISVVQAQKIKGRLAMAYLFCAWNAFALLVYYSFKERNPKTAEEENSPSKYYARLLRAPDAKVLRFEGLKLVDEYEIKGTVPPVRGKTREERERLEREKEEQEKEKRENLNLLVEETYSL